MKTTKEMFKIMKAYYEEGKIIQVRKEDNEEWESYDEDFPIVFNWQDFDYRIKPEPKERPMTFEEIIAYWKEHRTELFYIHFADNQLTGDLPARQCIIGIDFNKKKFIFKDYEFSAAEMRMHVRKEDRTEFEVEDE